MIFRPGRDTGQVEILWQQFATGRTAKIHRDKCPTAKNPPFRIEHRTKPRHPPKAATIQTSLVQAVPVSNT